MLRITIAALTIIAFAQPDSAAAKKHQVCRDYNQAGNKVRVSCSSRPSMQDELAAQQKIKANQPTQPTTQQCQMVGGKLVCK